MYHLGPGPFSGTLLHHYSRRSKLQSSRVPVFMLSKLLFHFLQRDGWRDPAGTWRRHFRRNGWTPWASRSPEGRLLRAALAMAINYGHAYRLATIAAVRDALAETFGAAVGPRLLCDVPHNGIHLESDGEHETWVARHNACRLQPGAPTIVAGSSDVPSYLGIGGEGDGGRWHSYDHGIGELLASGRLPAGAGTGRGSARYRMRRGPDGGLESRTETPARSPEPIERLMELFEDADVMRPVVRLRPLGTLKN
jgi:tRNA-splicing ligase RtcB